VASRIRHRRADSASEPLAAADHHRIVVLRWWWRVGVGEVDGQAILAEQASE
jgi:hypothetical protein